MSSESWLPDADLDDAANHAARQFDLADTDTRELVGMVADALEDSKDAVEDVVWDVQDRAPGVNGQDFVEDVATSLGYDPTDLW